MFVPCTIIRFGKDDEYRKKPQEGFFGFILYYMGGKRGGNWGEKARKEEKEEKGGKRAIFDKVAKNVDLERMYANLGQCVYESRAVRM